TWWASGVEPKSSRIIKQVVLKLARKESAKYGHKYSLNPFSILMNVSQLHVAVRPSLEKENVPVERNVNNLKSCSGKSVSLLLPTSALSTRPLLMIEYNQDSLRDRVHKMLLDG
ncbi:hypothetical protein L9F63_014999, partial [Diploptera punctata]